MTSVKGSRYARLGGESEKKSTLKDKRDTSRLLTPVTGAQSHLTQF